MGCKLSNIIKPTNIITLLCAPLIAACGQSPEQAPEIARSVKALEALLEADGGSTNPEPDEAKVRQMCQELGYNIIEGTPGDDELMGTSGSDCIFGYEGHDKINGLGSNDFIFGGPGDDQINGGEGQDMLVGGPGNDTIIGGGGPDSMWGGDGDDVMSGNAGDDTMDGGKGNDRMNGDEGADTMYGGPGDDEMHGGKGQDVMNGGPGADTMYGDEGADTMHGDEGADKMYGGEGKDTMYGDDGADEMHGEDGADTMYGGNGPDKMYGEAGADMMSGDSGNDELHGGAGADTMQGDACNDILDGEDGGSNNNNDGGNGYDACGPTSINCETTLNGIKECHAFGDCPAGFVCLAEQSRCIPDNVEPCGCVIKSNTDATCDGVDDDCDGQIDEDYVPRDTTCGTGACVSTGKLICQNGKEVDTCTPLPAPNPGDTICDGIDGDCDGTVDEGYQPVPTTCGVGYCVAQGMSSCVNGQVSPNCTPGPKLDDFDRTCDGVDDDCDGTPDDDFPYGTVCGYGPCGAIGKATCVDLKVVDTCVPRYPTAEICGDGVDNDCDGAMDELQCKLP